MIFVMLILAGTLPFLIPYSIRKIKVQSQRSYDGSRLLYEVVLPAGLKQDRVQAFLRAVGGNLRAGMGRWYGTPTIVFETHYMDTGIKHHLKVPESIASYVIAELHTSIPGVDVTPIEDQEPVVWTDGVELRMSNGARTLRIANAEDYAARILGSVPMVETDERVVVQWVISHSDRKKQTSKDRVASSEFSFTRALLLGTQAAQPEVQDRKSKESEQNFTAIGRIGVVAKPARARQLVSGVVRALRSENDDNQFIPKPMRELTAIESAATPLMMSCQFTVSELTPVIAWPIDDPQIAGLSQGSTRRIPATEAISRTGRVLGHSNIPGRERPVALAYEQADLHVLFAGMLGGGKSSLMANLAAQDMDNGYGVIVVDASGSRSDQSLYSRVLSLVPPERVKDVISINVVEDADNPVGFNLFDQGSGRGAIDQLVGVFTSLYPQIATGVAARDLLYHGIWTLLTRPGTTIIDLAALMRPGNPTEQKWREQIIAELQDQELKDFWARLAKDKKADIYLDVLMTKLWQLNGRPEIKNMLGQSEKNLNLESVLRDNKILLISLSGLPTDSAELLGTLIVSTLWNAAQRFTPEKSNFLYLDEFQVTTRVQEGLEDILRRSRKHKLGLVLGTQYIERLNRDLQAAILNSTGTQVIFQTGANEASIWRNAFGRGVVSEDDFLRIRKYEAIANIANQSGSSLVTIKALAPMKPTGFAQPAIQASRAKYGKATAAVRQEMIERRSPRRRTTSSRPIPHWLDQPESDNVYIE